MSGRFDLAVVGAGAAGLASAASGARRGASVVLLERLARPGKKLLATGGGRCNLLNEGLSAAAFTSTDPDLVASVFDRFGTKEIKAFFEGLGLPLQPDESGRVYPATNQAASVLKVLELETERRGVTVETGFDVHRINALPAGFIVKAADGRNIAARAVILAGGGRSYPALGSNGSCYGLAASLGHRIVPPVPSAVPLLVKGRPAPRPRGWGSGQPRPQTPAPAPARAQAPSRPAPAPENWGQGPLRGQVDLYGVRAPGIPEPFMPPGSSTFQPNLPNPRGPRGQAGTTTSSARGSTSKVIPGGST